MMARRLSFLNGPSVSAQVRPLKHELRRGSSCRAPGAVGGGCRTGSSHRSRAGRGAGSRSGAGARIAPSRSGSDAQPSRSAADSAG